MEGTAAADDSDETNSSKREMAALNELKSELVTSITPNHLLPHLKCLTSPDCENIKARERTEGARAGATLLLELIVKKQDWYSDLLSALRDDDISLGHLADRLENAYDENRQRMTSSIRKRDEPNSQGSSFAIYVRYVDKRTSARIMCEEGETIFDLCNKISEEIKEFRLHDDDMRMFETPHREIVIYKETKRDRKSHIGKQHPYPSRQPLKELKDTDLVFNILVSERTSMEDIYKQCCGQTIFLCGPDGHGKSATINTFSKVCNGRYRPLAST
ncbi:uncharacterized protein [Ptychodera flava]|uniref:uncharacterized protein n=1 Tax=Ptychodera flava TaxID=63121 RepID=UPI00396A8A72